MFLCVCPLHYSSIPRDRELNQNHVVPKTECATLYFCFRLVSHHRQGIAHSAYGTTGFCVCLLHHSSNPPRQKERKGQSSLCNDQSLWNHIEGNVLSPGSISNTVSRSLQIYTFVFVFSSVRAALFKGVCVARPL